MEAVRPSSSAALVEVEIVEPAASTDGAIIPISSSSSEEYTICFFFLCCGTITIIVITVPTINHQESNHDAHEEEICVLGSFGANTYAHGREL